MIERSDLEGYFIVGRMHDRYSRLDRKRARTVPRPLILQFPAKNLYEGRPSGSNRCYVKIRLCYIIHSFLTDRSEKITDKPNI